MSPLGAVALRKLIANRSLACENQVQVPTDTQARVQTTGRIQLFRLIHDERASRRRLHWGEQKGRVDLHIVTILFMLFTMRLRSLD